MTQVRMTIMVLAMATGVQAQGFTLEGTDFAAGMSPMPMTQTFYGDGEHHIISSYIEGNVNVTGKFYPIGEPFQKTTVEIINDGIINGDVTVGSLGIVHLAGGSIQGDLVNIADAGGIQVTAGTIMGNVEVTGITPLHISSGNISGNIYFGKSTSFFSITNSVIGGDITTAAVNFSDVSISNSILNGVLKSTISPKMRISDSLLNSGLEASSFSVFSLLDTGIKGDVVACDFAAIHIRGENLKVNGTNYFGRLSSFGSGNVTGLTLNDKLIDFDFHISDNAEIFLIPEPTIFLVLGLGGLAILRRRPIK